ncbi:potassium voltage-gated channel subfamily KQT member 1-like isoform X2 [Convolutriloba macropyga]|uniref:potassium voltage-gated channel subfamily KQT member 1-like isoform X2 n=1 Tax=Convolutriloba macropyga TaxID=536237 RepID=UPI003F524167
MIRAGSTRRSAESSEEFSKANIQKSQKARTSSLLEPYTNTLLTPNTLQHPGGHNQNDNRLLSPQSANTSYGCNTSNSNNITSNNPNQNNTTVCINVSVSHRPSIPPVSRLYSVAKLVEESENMVLKRNKKSFQTKVYNFLERPSGKLCITYHISVFVMVMVGILLGIVSTLDDRGEDRMNDVILVSEVFLLMFFTVEYTVRVWSAGCRVKYRGLKGRFRFARKPVAFIDLFVIIASVIALLSDSDSRIFAGTTIRGIRFLQMLRMLHVDRKGGSWRLLSSVVYIHRQELITTLYIGFLCLIFASYLVYLFEFNNARQPSSHPTPLSQQPLHGTTQNNPHFNKPPDPDVDSGTSGKSAQRGMTRRSVPYSSNSPSSNQRQQGGGNCLCGDDTSDILRSDGIDDIGRLLKEGPEGSGEGDSGFGNYADALWWGITTVTTIGYGDIVPRTWMGKVVASIFSVFAISFFALPAGILGSGFALKVQQKQRQKHFSRKIPAAASLIQCTWRCYSVHPKVELEIAWKVFTKGRVGLKDSDDSVRNNPYEAGTIGRANSTSKRESTIDFLKRNIESGSSRLRASMSSISEFNRKGSSCISTSKCAGGGGEGAEGDEGCYRCHRHDSSSSSHPPMGGACCAQHKNSKQLPVISIDSANPKDSGNSLAVTENPMFTGTNNNNNNNNINEKDCLHPRNLYDFENFIYYSDDKDYIESDSELLTIPKLTESHKNAIRLVRKLQFLVAKRKFQNCRQPYDVRDVMEQYSQGHISMMVRIKELQRRLDQNLGRTGPQYDSAYNEGRYKNCAIARLSRLETQMCLMGDRVEECLAILRRQQRLEHNMNASGHSLEMTNASSSNNGNKKVKKKAGMQNSHSKNRLSASLDNYEEEDI